MAKKSTTKNVSVSDEVKKAVSDKASRNIVAALAIIIGVLLILFNLAGIIYSVAGLVLIYFGLKLFGYSIPMPKM
ncbi:MAG: hypothetical protein KGH65_00395 [Candidatus Micrarchaeota archaeon]|nr:hypothetical protein [Candidatus Micrarchaeota archaeon]